MQGKYSEIFKKLVRNLGKCTYIKDVRSLTMHCLNVSTYITFINFPKFSYSYIFLNYYLLHWMPFMHVFIICYLWTLGNVLMNNASRKTIILIELGTCANFCVKALVAKRKLHLFGDCFCQKMLKKIIDISVESVHVLCSMKKSKNINLLLSFLSLFVHCRTGNV